MYRYWRKRSSQILFFLIIIGIVLNNQLIITNADDEIPITSNEEFFTVAVDYSDINASTYRLDVGGEVYNPLSLSLEEIKTNFNVTSEIVRLTCIAYKYGESSSTGVA
jgi:DMSO/TMAO reductase YedYZ molybdopterin-dependent catalytic subunit